MTSNAIRIQTKMKTPRISNRVANLNMHLKIPPCLFILLLVFLSGCISKAPKTAFYTLAVQPIERDADSSVKISAIENSVRAIHTETDTLGIGPITLPEYIRNSQMVSFTSESRLHIAANAAWAGDVNDNLTRVMGLYLSQYLPSASVQTFPWDRRARPAHQLLIRFHQFGGVKGKSITLDAQWQLINTQTKQLAKQGSLSVSEPLESASTQAYVAGLNRAVKTLTLSLSEKL